MSTFIQSLAGLEAQLAAIKAAVLDAAGPVHSSVKLAVAPFDPNPSSAPGGFTEATFDGYTSKTIPAWTAVYIEGGANAEIVGTSVLTWIPTGTTTPNTVVGYWLEGGDGTYLGAEKFDTPVPMASPADALNLIAKYQQQPGNWSSPVVP